MRFACLAAMMFCIPSTAQKVVGKWVRDAQHIRIRWAVNDTGLFVKALRHGWAIERTGKVQTIIHKFPSDSAWMKLVSKDSDLGIFPLLLEDPGKCPLALLHLALAAADRSFDAALLMGWAAVDELADSTMMPVYTLRVRGDTSVYLIPMELEDKHYPGFTGIKQEGRKVHLSWNARKFPSCAVYYIHRRDSAGNIFSLTPRAVYPIFEKNDPGENCHFTDTSAVSGACYTYLLQPVDAFGRMKRRDTSQHICLQSQGPDWIRIDSMKIREAGIISLFWSSDKKLSPEYIKVYRGMDVTRTDTLVVPERYDNKRIDICYKQGMKYMRAQCGETSSFPFYIHIPDTIPPDPPKGFKGSISLKGFVKLSWDTCTTNPVSCYKVFRSNSIQEEFVEVNRKNVSDTYFEDSLTMNIISGSVCYYVRASDLNYNTSAPSDTITLRRPDTIPPPIPRFVSWKIEGDTLFTRMACSAYPGDTSILSITGEKNSRSMVLNTGETELILNLDTFEAGNYLMQLMTADGSGHRTSSEVRTFEKPVKTDLRIDSLYADRDLHFISLQWNTVADICRFTVMRSVNKGPWHSIFSSGPGTGSFLDTSLHMGNIYTYRVVGIRVNAGPLCSESRELEY